MRIKVERETKELSEPTPKFFGVFGTKKYTSYTIIVTVTFFEEELYVIEKHNLKPLIFYTRPQHPSYWVPEEEKWEDQPFAHITVNDLLDGRIRLADCTALEKADAEEAKFRDLIQGLKHRIQRHISGVDTTDEYEI